MRKFRPTPIEAPEIAHVISAGIDDWVHQEAVTSINDRNQYLDSLGSGRDWLAMDYDNPDNLLTQKHISHHNRQRLWGDFMAEEPENDFATGRHIFNVLMQVSGLAKRMCYLAASDQDNYLELKRSPDVVGINTHKAVMFSIITAAIRSNKLKALNSKELQTQSLDAFANLGQDLDSLSVGINESFGRQESPHLTRLHKLQERWVGLVAKSAISAMSYRDGALSSVPVLEPKSISDEPQVIYPFKAPTA